MTHVRCCGDDDPFEGDALLESCPSLIRPRGHDLLERLGPYLLWQEEHCAAGLCPHPQSPAHSGRCAAGVGDRVSSSATFDFASRDALGLGASEQMHWAAASAVGAAGSDGAAELSRALEAAISDWLGHSHVVLFESGSDARVRTIGSLVHGADHVVIDRCASPDLAHAARQATPHVLLHGHHDLVELRAQLCELRATSASRAILVVAESFLPLESQAPDLATLRDLCADYEACLLIDASQDLGVWGPDGTGFSGSQGVLPDADVVVGAFSGPLVSSLGFAATRSRSAAEYLKYRSGLHVDQRGPSAIQSALAIQALQVARSEAGEGLRAEIAATASTLRRCLAGADVPCLGIVSPSVVVPLGWEGTSRLVGSALVPRGVRATAVELPVVHSGAARLWLRVPARMGQDRAERAAYIIAEAVRDARELAART